MVGLPATATLMEATNAKRTNHPSCLNRSPLPNKRENNKKKTNTQKAAQQTPIKGVHKMAHAGLEALALFAPNDGVRVQQPPHNMRSDLSPTNGVHKLSPRCQHHSCPPIAHRRDLLRNGLRHVYIWGSCAVANTHYLNPLQ